MSSLPNNGPPPDAPGIYLIANPPGGNVAQWLYNWATGTRDTVEQKGEDVDNKCLDGHTKSQIRSSDGGPNQKLGFSGNSSNSTNTTRTGINGGGNGEVIEISKAEDPRILTVPEARLQGDKSVNSNGPAGMLHLLPPILNWLASGQGQDTTLVANDNKGVSPRESQHPSAYSAGWKSPVLGKTAETEDESNGNNNRGVPISTVSDSLNGLPTNNRTTPDPTTVAPAMDTSLTSGSESNGTSIILAGSPRLLSVTPSAAGGPTLLQLRDLVVVSPAQPGSEELPKLATPPSSPSPPSQTKRQEYPAGGRTNNVVVNACQVSIPVPSPQTPSAPTAKRLENPIGTNATTVHHRRSLSTDSSRPDTPSVYDDNNFFGRNMNPTAESFENDFRGKTKYDYETDINGNIPLMTAAVPPAPPSTPTRGVTVLPSVPSTPAPSITASLPPRLRKGPSNPPQQPLETYHNSRPGTYNGQSGVAASQPLYNTSSVAPGYSAKKFIPINPNNSRNSDLSGVTWSSNFQANPTMTSSLPYSPPSARGNVSFVGIPNSVLSGAPVPSSVPVSSANNNPTINSVNHVPGPPRTHDRPATPTAAWSRGPVQLPSNVYSQERGASMETNRKPAPSAQTPRSSYPPSVNYTPTNTHKPTSTPSPQVAGIAIQSMQFSAPQKDMFTPGQTIPFSAAATINIFSEDGSVNQAALATGVPVSPQMPNHTSGFDRDNVAEVPDSIEGALLTELVRDATYYMVKMIPSSTLTANTASTTSTAPQEKQVSTSSAIPPPRPNQHTQQRQSQMRSKSEFSLELAAELPFSAASVVNKPTTQISIPPTYNPTATSHPRSMLQTPVPPYSPSTPQGHNLDYGFTIEDVGNGNVGWHTVADPSPPTRHNTQAGNPVAPPVRMTPSTRVFDSNKLKAWVLEVVANSCQGHCGKSPCECQEHTMKYLMAMVTSWRSLYSKTNGRFQFLDSEHFLGHLNDADH